jgi:3',5'-cyclic-AMP phosphodiesterase
MGMAIPNRLSRRDFVKGSLAAVGMALISDDYSSPDSQAISKEQMPVRWAFLSDLHIPEDVRNNYRGFYPSKNLEAIVPQVISHAPAAVAITGDLAQLTGQVGDYQNLKKLLTPISEKAPVFISLGNHDNRENFLRVFETQQDTRQSVAGKYVVVAETPPIRVIMLDSLQYTDNGPGFLGKTQRQWLADYLGRTDNTPTILCVHHMFADDDGKMIMTPWGEWRPSALLDLPRLYDIIVPISKVKAVIYGHSHAYDFSEHKGIHQINLPATGYTLSDKDPVGWVEAQWTAKGGDFILHATAGNRDKDGTVTKLTWRS